MKTERGAALLIVLMMLAFIMLLGASAAQMTLMNEKSSRNGRDHQIALLAAEAALHDAVLDLDFDFASGRGGNVAFPDLPGHCHANGAQAGLCRSDGRQALPSDQQLALAVAFGQFTARAFAHGNGMLASTAPRYLIELLELRPDRPPAQEVEQKPALLRYRITAVGFGPHQHSRALVQAVHVAETQPSSTLPRIGARLSWREIPDIFS